MNSCTRLFVHFVWSTWDRKPMIEPELQTRLYECIARQCRALKAQPLEIGGMPDHVHVMVRVPATVTIAQLAQSMKGGSSHLFKQISKLGSEFAWQGSYGAFTVSLSDVPQVREYIRSQVMHHAHNTEIAAMEQTSE